MGVYLYDFSEDAEIPVIKLKTTDRTHLHCSPDPNSCDTINYLIPKGSTINIDATRNCDISSGQDVNDIIYNIWCNVRDFYPTGRGLDNHRGWVNAYFLMRRDGKRYACVLYPNARGCK
jgi:hypothetical protein